MALERFWTMISLTMPFAVDMSFFGDFVGCRWPNSSRAFLRIMPSFELMNSAATLDSKYDYMTWHMMVSMPCTFLLFVTYCPFFVCLSKIIVP